MFFSAELLQKRDSGFGLLWLAATLGSQSSFKKLPRRSVMTADISQLCNLIADPAEPLALRLSSNLMVGVVRVYKVKQEILMTDVTACSNSLKKMVQDMVSALASDAHLLMAQPNVKASALTLTADPKAAALAVNFDNMITDWDKVLDDDGADEDYDPRKKSVNKSKGRGKEKAPPSVERPRGDTHTLQEYHDHIFSRSLDLSIEDERDGSVYPSQQFGEFGFGDVLFDSTDGLDLSGALGDDLARELGEGWGPPISQPRDVEGMDAELALPSAGMDFDAPMAMDLDMQAYEPLVQGDENMLQPQAQASYQTTPQKRKQSSSANDKENVYPDPGSRALSVLSNRGISPVPSFTQQLLSQDQQILRDVTPNFNHADNPQATLKIPTKTRRFRLLLDSRIELTNDELKAARAQYMQEQRIQRSQIMHKKLEKEGNKLREDVVCNAPYGIRAPELVNLWRGAFKKQNRDRVFDVPEEQALPAKRRRIDVHRDERQDDADERPDLPNFNEAGVSDQTHPGEFNMGFEMEVDTIPDDLDTNAYRHSSEDPEQARRASRPPSRLSSQIGATFRDQDVQLASQRSNFFPWDDAGISSSLNGGAFNLRGDAEALVDDGLRSPIIWSRRGSSLANSQPDLGLSPIIDGSASKLAYDFAFEVPQALGDDLNTQQSNVYLATLEKNSQNFFEYVKMQSQTLQIMPGTSTTVPSLDFNKIVPKASSTRHVAAAAFYHCLVLATKDLLRLHQSEPYGLLTLSVM